MFLSLKSRIESVVLDLRFVLLNDHFEASLFAMLYEHFLGGKCSDYEDFNRFRWLTDLNVYIVVNEDIKNE